MIVNGKSLLAAAPIKDMVPEKRRHSGLSYGLDESGYSIRTAQAVTLAPWRRRALLSSVERFQMPKHLMGRVSNKSTLARQWVDASRTTTIEPGWKGHLTIEVLYSGWKILRLPKGSPICQVIFEQLTDEADYGPGKYQNQPDMPVEARHDHS